MCLCVCVCVCVRAYVCMLRVRVWVCAGARVRAFVLVCSIQAGFITLSTLLHRICQLCHTLSCSTKRQTTMPYVNAVKMPVKPYICSDQQCTRFLC